LVEAVFGYFGDTVETLEQLEYWRVNNSAISSTYW